MNAAYFDIMDYYRANRIDLVADTISDIVDILRDDDVTVNKNDVSAARKRNHITPAARRRKFKGEPKLACKMMRRWRR